MRLLATLYMLSSVDFRWYSQLWECTLPVHSIQQGIVLTFTMPHREHPSFVRIRGLFEEGEGLLEFGVEVRCNWRNFHNARVPAMLDIGYMNQYVHNPDEEMIMVQIMQLLIMGDDPRDLVGHSIDEEDLPLVQALMAEYEHVVFDAEENGGQEQE